MESDPHGPDLIETLRRWQESGGALRVVQLSKSHAVVELCTCTGELMESIATGDRAVIDVLTQRAADGREDA
jgi:hypothetical protein